ncbi:MAG: hypothetical protein NZM00_11650, partial [Anaerolinea sp.]|nr:hypothetical protein [Anaerolinea sp.]
DPVTEFAVAQVGDIALFALGMGILFSHLWMIGQALRAGGISLSRERDGRAWDLLILTGVRARDLVIGKWAGLMWALWRQFRDLLLWRAAATAVLGVIFIINDAPLQVGAVSPKLIETLPLILVMTLCVALLGAINVPLALVTGMVGSALTRTMTGGMRMAGFVHLSGIVTIGLFIVTIVNLRAQPQPLLLYEVPRTLVLSLLDGGSLVSIALLSQQEILIAPVLAVAIGLPLFGAFSAGLLLLCIRLTVGRGASA